MPRKSAAAHAFPIHPGFSERLRPPPDLDEPARAVFLDLVSGAKPDAFRSSDLPLLCGYARAVGLEVGSAQELAAGEDKALARWEKAVKSMVALSMRLRLSPQARAPHTSRPDKPPVPLSYYDRMRLAETGDAES